MSFAFDRQTFHRVSYRCHQVRPRLWLIVFVLFAAWALPAALPQLSHIDAAGLHRVEQAVLIAAIIVVALTVALQIFSFWYSVRLRYLAWWAAGGIGSTWRWLTTGWRPATVLVVGVSAVWLIRSILLSKNVLHGNNPPSRADFVAALTDLLTFASIGKIILISIVLLFVFQVYRLSRRVVIVAFANHAGSQFDSCVAELPARLLNEFRRLSDLYDTVDEEGRPIGVSSMQGNLVKPKASTGDIGDDVRGAMGSDAKIELGPIKIPIGALVTVFTRLARGPQLTGSLHREGRRLVLLARIDGRIEGSWRVSGADVAEATSAAEAGAAVDPLLAELVYRVFTDITTVGSPKWQAVRCYSEGLRVYRQTLRTKQELQVRLRLAKSLFIEAHAEDDKFARCYYNLGIVDQVLRKDDAARAAYQSALARDPKLVDAAYALASIHWSNEDYLNALHYSERAIQIDADDARSWNLRGFALGTQKKQTSAAARNSAFDPELLPDVVETREIAAAVAWRRLCRLRAAGDPTTSAKEVAQRCLNNAAYARTALKRSRSAISVFRQALVLGPDAALNAGLGKSLAGAAKYTEAAHAFRLAVVLEPNITARAEYSMRLAETELARLGRSKGMLSSGEAAIAACQSIMRAPWALSNKELFGSLSDVLKALTRAFGKADERIKDVRMKAAHALIAIRALRRGDHKTKEGIERLQRLLDKHGPRAEQRTLSFPWARGIIEAALGGFCQQNKHWEEATSHFKNALGYLKSNYVADVRDFNLESALAEALLRKNKIDEALEYARSASVEYSEDSSDWSALGHVYFLKNDFHNALAAWETAIVLKPENADNYQRVFFAYSRLALLLRDPARRTELLRNGIGFAETAAELGDQDTVVWAHFWSAMLASLVPDFDKAIAHCNIIQDKPPLKCFVAYLLGELNLQRGDYDSSFDAFAKAVKETWREIRTRRAKIKARTKRKTSAFHQLADDLAEWPLGAILCQSLLGLARGYAERDTGFDKALLGFVGQEIRAICARLSCQRHELGKDGCCLLRRLRGMDHYQTSSCSFRDAGTINIQKEWVDRQTSIGSH